MRKKEKAHFGETIITESSPDRSGHKVRDTLGKRMAGGADNLSHSIAGARATGDRNDKPAARRRK